MTIKTISASDKDMVNGMRNTSKTPLWQDECRASLIAAHNVPGLTDIDKRDLVLDAVYRAKEYGQLIEMNDFMKEAVYGYGSNERKITREFKEPRYVSEDSQERAKTDESHDNSMRKVRRYTRSHDDFER